jgi:hypothetical protein
MAGTIKRAMRGRAAFAMLLAALLAAGAFAECPRPLSRAEIAAHLRLLSDDLLEGRGIGTRGDLLTQAYLETAMASSGLEPAFADGFRQAVQLRRVEPDPGLVLTISGRGGPARRMGIGEQLIALLPLPQRQGELSGQLLFAGYGIESKEWAWDDYKDVDVTGKILMVLVNEPGRDRADLFEGPALTWHGRWVAKLEEAARRGALGVLLVHTTADAGYSWAVVHNSWSGAAFFDPGDAEPTALRGWIAEDAARSVLEMAGLDFSALRAAAELPSFRPVATGLQVTVRGNCPIDTVVTANVAGVVRGRGEAPRRTLVVSAHHDHFGIATPEHGDAIYNGAIDNGSALALLLALARAEADRPVPLAADVLFLAPGAEEEGMLGSRAFLRRSPVPVDQILADLNLEMTWVWGRTRDLVAIGGAKSELGTVIAEVAHRHGLGIGPEPAPEQGFFFRSDQLSFARAGVPAAWIDCGETLADGSDASALRRAYRESAYHRPDDEFDPSWDLGGAVQLGDVLLDLLATLDAHPGPLDWTSPGSP